MSAEAPWLDAPVVDDPEPWKSAPIVEDKEQPWLSAPVVEEKPQLPSADAGFQWGLDKVRSKGPSAPIQSIPITDADRELTLEAARLGRAVTSKDGKLSIAEPIVSENGVGGFSYGAGTTGLRLTEGAARLVGAKETADELGKALAFTEQNFAPKDRLDKVTSGVAGAASMIATPGGLPGLLTATGLQAVAGGYDQAYAEAKAAGKTEEDARSSAQMGAFKTTLRAVPEMAAYWLVGLGAAKSLSPVVQQSSPLVKAAVTGAGATAANVATSTALHAIHNEPLFTPEGLAQDAVFGFGAHGLSEAQKAVQSEATLREHLQRAPREALEAAATDPEFRKASPYDPKLIDQELARRDAEPLAGTAAEPPPPTPPTAPDAAVPALSTAESTRLKELETRILSREILPPEEYAELGKLQEHRDAVNFPAEPLAEPAPAAREGSAGEAPAEPSYAGGPGAMGPVEAGEMRQSVTGVKNAQVEAERIMRGEEPMTKEEPLPNRQAIAEAVQANAADPTRPFAIIERINNGSREISVADQASLMAHRVDLMNERNRQEAILADGNQPPEVHAVTKRNLDHIEGLINEVDQAGAAMGTEGGRFLQLRQRLLQEDYTPEAMENRARIKKGDALSESERATIKNQASELDALNKKLAAHESKSKETTANKGADDAISAMRKETEASASPESKFAPRVIALAESIVTRLDTAADAARKRIRERLGNANALIDPTVIYDVAVIGVSKLARKSLDFAKWSIEMKADLGDWVEPHLEEAWKTTEELWKGEEKKVSAADRPAVARVREKNLTEAEKTKRLTDGISQAAKDGDTIESVRPLIEKLALQFVREGTKEREPLVDRLHAAIKDHFPDIDRTTTREILSGYGIRRKLDPEPAKVRLREIKGESQQIAKIDALQKAISAKQKENPLKPTGPERRTMSDEERKFQKEVNELKKQGKFVTTDPANQLKTAMDSIKTRLRNEIRDLDNAMATQERIPGKKSSIEYDAEAKALKEQRDAKRAEYDKLFPKEKLTDEQLLTQAGKTIDRSIADLETSLKEGRLYPDKTSRRLTSPEIEAKRARLNALREERQHLRDLDTATVEAKKEKALLEAINHAENWRSRAGKSEPATPTADTARVAELKELLKGIQKVVREDKAASPEAVQAKLQAATEAVRSRIGELDRKLREGDSTTKAAKEPLRSDELDNLRMERDAMERAYREIVNAEKPKKSRDEIALQAYKTRTANRIAELEDKVARGDFEAKPKPEPPKLDREALDLKAKIEQTKQQYYKGLNDMKLAQRTTRQKILDGIGQTLDASKNVRSSFDFSAPRQGAISLLANATRIFTNPGLIGRATRDMFRAWASESLARRIEQEIKSRPNAKNGLDKKAKIEFTEIGESKFTGREENARSVLDDWAELPLQTGNAAKTAATAIPKLVSRGVRMSNRAFITFLNKTRADLFDHLLEANFKDRAPTTAELEAVGNYVNVATGRGNLNPKLASAASYALWAPKLLKSRIDILTGQPFKGGSARTKLIVAKEYGRILTSAALLYAVSRLFSDKKETDSRSSDFGKVVIGNSHIDPWGGLQQVTVLEEKLRTGQTKTLKGEVKNTTDKQERGKLMALIETPLPGSNGGVGNGKRAYGGDSPFITGAKFVRSKLRPDLGMAVDLIDRGNMVGQKVTPGTVAKNMLVPMTFDDIIPIMKEHGIPKGVAIQILNEFGAGVSHYETDDKIKEAQR